MATLTDPKSHCQGQTKANRRPEFLRSGASLKCTIIIPLWTMADEYI